jgi:hypothetical protein
MRGQTCLRNDPATYPVELVHKPSLGVAWCHWSADLIWLCCLALSLKYLHDHIAFFLCFKTLFHCFFVHREPCQTYSAEGSTDCTQWKGWMTGKLVLRQPGMMTLWQKLLMLVFGLPHGPFFSHRYERQRYPKSDCWACRWHCKSFNKNEVKQWKAGVQNGVEKNDLIAFGNCASYVHFGLSDSWILLIIDTAKL